MCFDINRTGFGHALQEVNFSQNSNESLIEESESKKKTKQSKTENKNPENSKIKYIYMFYNSNFKTNSGCARGVLEIRASRMYVCMHVCMYGHTCSKSVDQPDRVANPGRGRLNRENEYFPILVRA